MMKVVGSAFVLLLFCTSASAQVEWVWLTHRTSEPSYVLLTVEQGGKMTVEIKRLDGEVLDRKEYPRK